MMPLGDGRGRYNTLQCTRLLGAEVRVAERNEESGALQARSILSGHLKL